MTKTQLQIFANNMELKNRQLQEELKEAKRLLIETASELNCMIDMKNTELELNIQYTDLDDPDYFDAETVHKAMKFARQ